MLTMTDLFAGFGGASSGAVAVPGIDLRIAANHWRLAVDVHQMNHEQADHACVDLHLEDPAYFPATDLLWASPECTKWSQAGGAHNADLGSTLGDPTLFDTLAEDDLVSTVEDEATRSRLLMFDVLRFIERHRYAAVIVENVVDIAMRPKFARAWEAWRLGLRNLGYDFRVVSLNSMHAQVLGAPAPQSRDRLYVIAWPRGNRAPDVDRFIRPSAWCPRCDTIVEARQAWKPGKTVGKYRAQYVYACTTPGCGQIVEPAYLPALAAIDWSIPGTRIGDRDRPLADKTLARIIAGIARYWGPSVIEAGGNQYDTAETKALLVPVEGRDGKTVIPADHPLRTQTTRSELGIAFPPFIVEYRGGGSDARAVDDPLATITAQGNHHGLAFPPFLTQFRDRVRDLLPHERPLPTIVADGANHALIMRNNTARGDQGQMSTPVTEWMRTLTTAGHQSLLTADDIAKAAEHIEDVRFRMLEPHEIGAGMAFAPDYKVAGTRRDQVKGYGNAVTPPAARDLVACVAESLGVVA